MALIYCQPDSPLWFSIGIGRMASSRRLELMILATLDDVGMTIKDNVKTFLAPPPPHS